MFGTYITISKFIHNIQQVPDNEGALNVTTDESLEEYLPEAEDSSSAVRSTKRPTTVKEPNTKRKKRESQEDLILQRAVSCMERAEKNITKGNGNDGDDVFGQYVAFELKSMDNPHIKRVTKWKIQSLIYHTHSECALQPYPPWQHPEQPLPPQEQAQPRCYPAANQLMPISGRSSSASTFSIPDSEHGDCM